MASEMGERGRIVSEARILWTHNWPRSVPFNGL